MSKVAILTDSNSGLSPQEAKDLGIFVVPMPFTIDDKEYFEDISITKEEFFEMLKQDCKILTSQPTVGTLMDTWDSLLETHDEVIYIPMSSGLSGSCETATLVAEDYEGKVFVVNNQRISITQAGSAIHAKKLADMGYSAEEIYDILTRDKFESSIYIMVDT
ncbi:MAG: DegV family EDD domain-containing protein, partial [Clostridiales bacterium]|nr:DegV family EDD domain-containing protein [Clostridiales bacterium]